MNVRPAAADDISWVDSQQRANSASLGFLPLSAIQRRMETGGLLIAEDQDHVRHGYLLGNVGSVKSGRPARVFQICVAASGRGRGTGRALLDSFIGALPAGSVGVAVWVASDLPAAAFWEAAGFVPLAWRPGGKAGDRFNVYLYRRLTGDAPAYVPDYCPAGPFTSRTPRPVLPIPRGQDWRGLDVHGSAMADAVTALTARLVARQGRIKRAAACFPAPAPPPVRSHAWPFVIPDGTIRVLVGGRHVHRPLRPQ